MKYKFERWIYNEFEYEAAEEHLNRMADRGWELYTAYSNRGGTASYIRNPAARGFRYTLDAAGRDDAGYIDFCRDVGWEPVSQLKNGICIFVSRDGRGKPLHTDETVKYDHILKVISERHLFKGQAANVIKLIAVAAIMVWAVSVMAEISVFLSVMYGMIFVPSLCYYINVLYTEKALWDAAAGKTIIFPGWLHRVNRLLGVWLLIVLAASWIFTAVRVFGSSYQIVWYSMLIASPLAALLGVFLQGIKRNADVGYGLLISGIVLFLGSMFGLR